MSKFYIHCYVFIYIYLFYAYTYINEVCEYLEVRNIYMEQLVYSPESLGSAIRRQRKTKKLSQEEAGKPFKIGQRTVSSLENGAPGTEIDTLFRMLAALDLEMIIRSKNRTKTKTKNTSNEVW